MSTVEETATGRVHVHGLYDTDAHYIIDPITREIRAEHPLTRTIAKYDHNSEIITFELPKTVDGHDMLLSNRVWVHYINIDAKTRKENRGIYEVNDLQPSKTDENTAVCSWTITRNSTQLAGVLSFSIRFACIDEAGNEVYGWGTANYDSIIVCDRNHNSEIIVEEYADILEQWHQKLFSGEGNNAGSACDCVIAVDRRPPLAGNAAHLSVVSGSLMRVWEKVSQGVSPKVLLQYLGAYEGDFFNYFAESVHVEHMGWSENGEATAVHPEFLLISFVLSTELIVIKSTSGAAITGNVISTYTVTTLGGASAGNAGTDPDLVIGLNVVSTKVKEDGTSNARNLSCMTVEDVSIISGSVSAVAEKVRQGLPVKVLLQDIHFYWDNIWYQNIGEANNVMVLNRATYPDENATILNAVFFLSNMGVSATEPCLVRFTFDMETGNPLEYRFNKLTCE